MKYLLAAVSAIMFGLGIIGILFFVFVCGAVYETVQMKNAAKAGKMYKLPGFGMVRIIPCEDAGNEDAG